MTNLIKPFAAALSFAVLAGPVQASNHGMMNGGSSGAMPKNGQSMLRIPMMNPARGRELFAEKGCVVCHSINGIGGEDAPAIDASQMSRQMNPFEFAARMWRGAPAMIAMQQMELGYQIELTGSELANIIAFVHSPGEQVKFSEDDIPENIREFMHEAEHGE